jgi:outer membrane protein
MKIKILLISAFVYLTAFNASAQKIGYLNTNELLLQMKEVKQADSILTKFAEDLQKVYSDYVMEYQQKLGEYQQFAATWSEVKRESVETDLGNLQIRISDFEKKSNQDLENKKEELYNPILDNINAKIKQVGEENKFTTILEKNSMLYTGTDAIDIMPMMKKKLGIQ